MGGGVMGGKRLREEVTVIVGGAFQLSNILSSREMEWLVNEVESSH